MLELLENDFPADWNEGDVDEKVAGFELLVDEFLERVTGLGASLVEIRSHPGERWAVMQDPEGNEFCLH